MNWTPESASIDGLNVQAIKIKTGIRSEYRSFLWSNIQIDELKADLPLHLSGGWSIINLLPREERHVCI
ncbi:hypothetical protein [Aeromonas veronii]|uniref:hypothetical protein n=1 Tax=Aeromonas veronii TaxID=654 RepID=UPI0013A6955D|nr:hypothetical protein [Aeromonas veronii]MBL0590028.1 hypothetical protein [Aeromonas veronii]